MTKTYSLSCIRAVIDDSFELPPFLLLAESKREWFGDSSGLWRRGAWILLGQDGSQSIVGRLIGWLIFFIKR